MIKEKIQDQAISTVQETLASEIKSQFEQSILPDHKNIQSVSEQDSKLENFEATEKAKKVLTLFQHWFTAKHLSKLNLPKIEFRGGKWYSPWDSGYFQVDLEPDHELNDSKITRPSYENPVQQSLHELQTYLTHKFKRKNDNSFFAKTHKTLLAKLCHKCIERIEFLPDKAMKRSYYVLLKQFLASIWEDADLINPRLRGDKNGLHLEDFIYAQMQICEQRNSYLSYENPPLALASWADTLDQELAALHICGARIFHFLLQNKPIPDNLEKHLRTLGLTYHRLNLQCDQKGGGESLKLYNKNRSQWESISKSAQLKLKNLKINPPFLVSDLMRYVQSNTLSLEEAVFSTVGEYYTAEQCLYLALYQPEYLDLTSKEKVDLLGSAEFLDLYRTIQNPAIGFQWLSWHMQQASSNLFSALQILTESNEEDEIFQIHLKKLIRQVHSLREAPILELHHVGALPEFKKAITYQVGIIDEFEQRISQIQQQLHCLVLIRSLLAQYRQLLPQTGELIGILAFQTDLTLIAQVVTQTIKTIQVELSRLIPLQGMGFSSILDASQILIMTKQSSLLGVVDGISKPSKGLVTWRSHKGAREKALDDLETRLSVCHAHTLLIHSKTSPKRVQHLAKKSERQFKLARVMLIEGLGEHLSGKEREGLKKGEEVITKWLEILDSKVTQIKDHKDFLVNSSEQKDRKISTIIEQTVSAPKLQQPAIKQIVSTIETKAEALMQWTAAFTDCASRLILSDSPHFMKEWHQLLTHEEENFYYELGKIRNQFSDELLIHFFQTKLGFLFSPLPIIEKPKKFLWWYRHTLCDRSLFLKMFSLSALINWAKQPAHRITLQQRERLQKLLNHEQEILFEQQISQWSWLDSFHRHVKTKLVSANVRVCHLLNESQCVPILSEAKTSYPKVSCSILHEQKSEKKLEQKSERSLALSLKPEENYIPVTPQLYPKKEQKSISTTEDIQPLDQKLSLEPLLFQSEFNPSSARWKQYQENLSKSDDLEKIKICVIFFSSALVHLEDKPLIENHPEVAKRCKAVITLFWNVIQLSKISDSVLGISLYSLHKCFSENSPSVQQYFFIKQAKSVVRNYQELLPEPKSNKINLQ